MAPKKKPASPKSSNAIVPAASVRAGSGEQLSLFPKSSPNISFGAAPHVMGGFIYQLTYATLAALKLRPGEELGVEVVDDVDVMGPDGSRHIQTKNELTPVTDFTRGMWKAIAAWSQIPRSGRRCEHVSLELVTTAEVRGELPRLLLEEAGGRVIGEYVLHKLGRSENEEVQTYIDRVKELPPATLFLFLDRIWLRREPDAVGLAEALRAELRTRLPDDAIDSAAREFCGFVSETVAAATAAQRTGAIITWERVREVLLNLQSRHLAPRWRYRHSATKVTEGDHAANKGKTFLRQLEAIEAPHGYVNMALSDYLRQQKEEIDWARNLEIKKNELQAYREQIFATWDYLKEDLGGEWKSLDEKERGRRLCARLLERHSPPLAGDLAPPQHVYRGSCHGLADIPEIGWHGKWRELFIPGEVAGDKET